MKSLDSSNLFAEVVRKTAEKLTLWDSQVGLECWQYIMYYWKGIVITRSKTTK